MMQRIVTALVLGALLLLVLLRAPASWTLVVITVAIVASAWEWSAFLKLRSLPARAGYVLLTVLLLAAAWAVSATPQGLLAVLWIAAGWWLIALLWIMLRPHSMTAALAWLAGLLVLVPAWVALVRMRLEWEQGAYWTLYLLLLVWAADTGAYFAGKSFGCHKLAPQVSPGKTWEGVAGGLLLAMLMAYIGSRWLIQPAVSFIAVSVVVAVFSIVGDLTESMLKRYAGLKDSGNLIPGHGGIMDRMDSITAAAPLLMLGLLLTRAAGV